MAKMTSIKMKRLLEDELKNPDYRVVYKRDDDAVRIEWKESKEGMSVSLPNLIAKYNDRGKEAVDEIVEHVNEALKIMNQTQHLKGMEKQIFPVLRSPSFPTETKAGKKLIYKDHTAETRVFYALDLGKSYRLIDDELLEEEGWSKERLDEIATFNIRSLTYEPKMDQVAGNDFYFLATQDGYDASRILNEAFLEEMLANAKGELTVAVPHQDVLILGDIQNKAGYDILAQMTMKFFADGRIPITSLPFVYENKKLEPVFILAKNRPENN
ncbi:DUF1444 domain-containing protein [Oceanobacillus jeddahense]|uniref:UPF0354 protein NP439_17495 n=1 Tax=Oceanobacillus jeddahense TaxID=1462527 RepID=A0ABY5JNY8_9BACI|nr:DUF1444 domain-containing protein [Oceanobacillus jeddahense]UUI01831.1 DUF1444 domain-containing protein [Oceanobacillus jeddahense]